MLKQLWLLGALLVLVLFSAMCTGWLWPQKVDVLDTCYI